MIKIEQKIGKKSNQKCDVNCRVCKRSTRHTVLTDACIDGLEDYGNHQYMWTNDYQVVQCLGCETISFRLEHSNSEDMEEIDDNEWTHAVQVDLYPNPESGREAISDIEIVPTNLQRIYQETIRTLNGGQRVLTGIGIRAIVETVCKDKNANGRDLFAKINDLVSQGVLTRDGADILHKLRTLGNQSAHEVKPHDSVQLGLAMDVIDHLLQGVYILPHHANTKFR